MISQETKTIKALSSSSSSSSRYDTTGTTSSSSTTYCWCYSGIIILLLHVLLISSTFSYTTSYSTTTTTTSSLTSSIYLPYRRNNCANHAKNTILTRTSLSTSDDINNNNNNDQEEKNIILTNSFLKDKASLLESAFNAMDDKDKYDAVLTGLCSKVLDSQTKNTITKVNNDVVNDIASDAILTTTQLALKTMSDAIKLLEEMNSRRVKASSRSLMALIDATVTTNDPITIAQILSLTLKNGSLSFYGSLQSSITPLPPTPSSKIISQSSLSPLLSSSSSSSMTRQQRLNKLPNVPIDERSKEVTAALSTMSILGISFILQGVGNGLDLDELATITSFLSYGIIGILILDNFLDAISALTSFVIKMNSDKLPNNMNMMSSDNIKENMPLQLGSGKITGVVVRGFTRLFAVDTERECQCEAAAFFVAYSLGLPCFSFRPNALEAAVLLFESNNNNNNNIDRGNGATVTNFDSLLSDTGIMKMLIWLMAPVAIESSFHPQLISSNPKEARGFLQRLKEKARVFGAEDVIESILQSGNNNDSDEEIEDLLKWSYAEADLLLRQNRVVVTELTERLIGGASTVGDCVAVLENWE